MSDTSEEYGPDFSEWVVMAHEGIEGHAVATVAAHAECHAENGWEVVANVGFHRTAPEYTADQLLVMTGEAASLTKPELQELAQARGLDDSGTKSEIIERLESAEGGNV